MRIRTIAMLAAAAVPIAGTAQTASSRLVPCERIAAGLTQVSVGEDLSGVRTFYDGQVTLLLLDSVEPACCSFGLAVLMPDGNGETEPAGIACWAHPGHGGIDLRAATSRYDPAEGLTLDVPTRRYDPDSGEARPGDPIRLRIDGRSWTITELPVGAR